ncbi:hypothetical protein [Ramlibacter sp.]|uniref:hypothetical protein n=1 Tax=Ramlibacter sp. TaxID=1917967 RepID=UPI00262C790C|nr:hypothetical protein [Ramlibacter sp.]
MGEDDELEEGYYSNQSPSRLQSVEAVGTWAKYNGGELRVRTGLANGEFVYNSQVAEKWLELQERKRTDAYAEASLETARRAAVASERAARYAMWGALISAASGIVFAATYFITRVPG